MSSLTTKVLIEIRDEIKATRTDLREEIRFLTGAHKTAHEESRRRVDDLDLRVTRLEGEKPGRRRAG